MAVVAQWIKRQHGTRRSPVRNLGLSRGRCSVHLGHWSVVLEVEAMELFSSNGALAWKRLLLCDFPEEPPPPLWISPPATSHPGQPLCVPELPRKRKIDAGAMTEPSASPSKRLDSGDTNAPGGAEREGRSSETSEPPPLLHPPPLRPCGPGEEPRGARPLRGGGDDGAGRAEPPQDDWGTPPLQLSEEFWQYNTFQFWRNPLPPIDLADLEDVNADNLPEARLQGKNEVLEVDMES